MTKSVLIIDDSEDFRETLTEILLDYDFIVFDANCPARAFSFLENETVDLILCDLNMPFTVGEFEEDYERSNRVGIETIRELGWVFPEIPIIAISAATEFELQEASQRLGDLTVLSKPISPKALISEIASAFRYEYVPVLQ